MHSGTGAAEAGEDLEKDVIGEGADVVLLAIREYAPEAGRVWETRISYLQGAILPSQSEMETNLERVTRGGGGLGEGDEGQDGSLARRQPWCRTDRVAFSFCREVPTSTISTKTGMLPSLTADADMVISMQGGARKRRRGDLST